MTILDIIEKKKRKQALTKEEIDYFVDGFTSGEIPDYQISPLLMAIVLNGMNDDETFALTDAMLNTGDVVDTSSLGGVVVDKHSTGGVGDSTTLALAPILACCGVYVAKMSGRGLGFTGGTLDKLESIPNLTVQLSEEEFLSVVKNVGCAVVGQTKSLVPADKKLYALRDVTGTIDSIPLIAASIMSKKLASGSDVILLDVKYGTGAFMKTKEDAVALAEKMVAIGTRAGKSVGALITDMSQPLSSYIGNSIEIIGIVRLLRGEKSRLYNEIKEVAVRLLTLSGKFDEVGAEQAFDDAITSGRAFDKFAEMVAAQHGDASILHDLERFEIGNPIEIRAKRNGYVYSMATAEIGNSVTLLGGGRLVKEDTIDHSVGIVMKVAIGDVVKRGDVLCTVYHKEKGVKEAVAKLSSAIEISAEKPHEQKIAYAFVDKDGVHIC